MSQQPGGSPPIDLGPIDGLDVIDSPDGTDDDDLEPISLVYDEDEIGVVDEPLASQPEELIEGDAEVEGALDVADDTIEGIAATRHAEHHDFEASP